MRVAQPRARPPDERFSPAPNTLSGSGPPAAFGNLLPLDPCKPDSHTAEPKKAS